MLLKPGDLVTINKTIYKNGRPILKQRSFIDAIVIMNPNDYGIVLFVTADYSWCKILYKKTIGWMVSAWLIKE